MQACRKARLSVYEIQKAIHKYYEDCKLYPRGLRTEMACVQQWGMRMADALAKLAPRAGFVQVPLDPFACYIQLLSL